MHPHLIRRCVESRQGRAAIVRQCWKGGRFQGACIINQDSLCDIKLCRSLCLQRDAKKLSRAHLRAPDIDKTPQLDLAGFAKHQIQRCSLGFGGERSLNAPPALKSANTYQLLDDAKQKSQHVGFKKANKYNHKCT